MKATTGLNFPEFSANTGIVVVIAPIVPEKAEAWRRLLQEAAGSRRRMSASRRRLGIRTEQAWIGETRQWTVGMLAIEIDDARQVLAALSTSNFAFDCWFREQLLALQSVDLIRPPPAFQPELVFAWHDNQRKGDEQR